MRIILKEPELDLEVNKVDTPTGAAWCVKMPDERKVLITFHHGKWDTAGDFSNQLVQAIGNQINQFFEADKPEKLKIGISGLNQRPKRERIPKHLLIHPFLPVSYDEF